MAKRLDWNSVRLVKAKRSNKWVAEFHQDGKRKQLSTGFEDREWAEKWVESKLFAGQPAMTIEECLDIYEAEVVPSVLPGTRDTWPIAKRTIIDGFGADRPVSSLKARDYLAFARDCQSGKVTGKSLANSTINMRLGKLRAAINHCHKMGHLKPEEMPGPIVTMKADSIPKEPISIEEFKELLAKAGAQGLKDIEAYLHIAGNTGARVQAILDLEWRQIDFDAGIIHFRKPEEPINKKKVKPSAPMSDALHAYLEKIKGAHSPTDKVTGNRLSRNVLNHWLRDNGPNHMSSHILRHSYITWQTMAGTPIYIVSQITGNSPAMIAQVYAHFSPTHSAARQAANAISATS